MSEPVKHHFIPQFILRNFTHNNDQIYYWNKETSKLEVRNTKSVYMVKNLYRDEKNIQLILQSLKKSSHSLNLLLQRYSKKK